MNRPAHRAAATFLFVTGFAALAGPTITRQPADYSVSLGANVINTSLANGVPPLTYQWWFNGRELPGVTNASLALTNVQVLNAGSYSVIVTDSSGSVTSRVARLDVDPTFTKVTTGAIVTDRGNFFATAWGDYDNDGYEDLFAANLGGLSLLYHNNRNGTFTKVTTGRLGNLLGNCSAAVWGDYDNDGYLDHFIAHTNDEGNSLFHNDGDGTFNQANVISDRADSSACSWGDYDNDGHLDLFVCNLDRNDFLYRGAGDGTNFTKITSGPLVKGVTFPLSSPWGDFNNDGLLDLFVADRPKDLLYQNAGSGIFIQVTNPPVATDPIAGGDASAWADYDNDGYLDLFVTDNHSGGNRLYHNNGDATFTQITNSVVTRERNASVACAWGDYDNDGYLDAIVGNNGQNNSLYHNNGDGTFTRVMIGSLVNDKGASFACAWSDFDNDGFLDLFVANANGSNFLYRNNGNSHSWIKIKLLGTLSNRGAIGAKVRVKATVNSKKMWQLREISTGDGFDGNTLVPHFGLGDATNIETVRIEWPSGMVQELLNVPANQILTLREPSKLSLSQTNGLVKLDINSWKVGPVLK